MAAAGTAWAGLGQPSPWQIGLQESATPVMDNIIWFHDFLLYIITGIAGFVLVLLVIIVVKFNARANPTPSRTTHNTALEVAWTLIPVVILVLIAVPSFRLLFLELNTPQADLTIKATGKQWYWTYSYPDNGQFEFDSILVRDFSPGHLAGHLHLSPPDLLDHLGLACNPPTIGKFQCVAMNWPEPSLFA